MPLFRSGVLGHGYFAGDGELFCLPHGVVLLFEISHISLRHSENQVQTEAQVAPQEEAQHHDKAHQEEDPWEGQEQVLNKEDRVNNLQVSGVINVSL